MHIQVTGNNVPNLMRNALAEVIATAINTADASLIEHTFTVELVEHGDRVDAARANITVHQVNKHHVVIDVPVHSIRQGMIKRCMLVPPEDIAVAHVASLFDGGKNKVRAEPGLPSTLNEKQLEALQLIELHKAGRMEKPPSLGSVLASCRDKYGGMFSVDTVASTISGWLRQRCLDELPIAENRHRRFRLGPSGTNLAEAALGTETVAQLLAQPYESVPSQMQTLVDKQPVAKYMDANTGENSAENSYAVLLFALAEVRKAEEELQAALANGHRDDALKKQDQAIAKVEAGIAKLAERLEELRAERVELERVHRDQLLTELDGLLEKDDELEEQITHHPDAEGA